MYTLYLIQDLYDLEHQYLYILVDELGMMFKASDKTAWVSSLPNGGTMSWKDCYNFSPVRKCLQKNPTYHVILKIPNFSESDQLPSKQSYPELFI